MSSAAQRNSTQRDSKSYIHATAVIIAETGILIRGRSGAGKSGLALALLARGEQARLFARLVGDDRVAIEACNGRLLVRPHPAIAGSIEKRGEGILRLPFEAKSVVRLVVDFVTTDPARDIPPRLPADAERQTELAGISLPRLMLAEGVALEDLAARVIAQVRGGY
jgi:serine kinase of HPr protein (carbohydrate metabolism regulator)